MLLQEGTNISLPPDQRQALDAELEALLDEYRPLKLTALSEYETTQNPDYSRLAQTYASLIDRVEKAQTRINAGLSIDSVKCAGQGKALKGKRYKHFRCDATSYVQEIPSVELKPVAGPNGARSRRRTAAAHRPARGGLHRPRDGEVADALAARELEDRRLAPHAPHPAQGVAHLPHRHVVAGAVDDDRHEVHVLTAGGLA